jgi:hypothetical protein
MTTRKNLTGATLVLRRYLAALCLFGALHVTQAHASSDMSCDGPSPNLTHSGYDRCNNVPFLSPANDTRLNLQLLLIDGGRLIGPLDRPKKEGRQPEQAELLVPFDLDDWQVRETDAAAEAQKIDGDNAQPDSSEYAVGEGSRCRYADDGFVAFRDAVTAAKSLPASEAKVLIDARGTLVANCQATPGESAWASPAGIQSPLGKQFANYMAGAHAFYTGAFGDALKDFEGAVDSADPWLREAARYMIGRTQFNAAQLPALGEWGDLQQSKVDKTALAAAENAFNAYLRDFPQGIYAVSAHGLLRRIYWLAGDQARLASAYDEAFRTWTPDTLSNVSLPELVQEADNKLLSSVNIEQIKSPFLLATIDLMRMRPNAANADGTPIKLISLAELQAQKERFAGNPALYDYVQAALYLYVNGKPDQAMALLPAKPAAPLNYFVFSQQTLRAFALEASQRSEDARQLVLQLMPMAKLPWQREQLELQLAMIEERTGQVDRVFATGSPITDPAIRTILLEHSASAELLRERAKDHNEASGVRDAALYTLLYKELTGGKYQAFQADLALLPSHPAAALAPFAQPGGKNEAGYTCPSLRDVAATLQQNGDDAKSLNCVGEWERLNDVHYQQDFTPPKTYLGGQPSPFPGTNYSRLDGYMKVIANDHADSDAKAYALFRAINCFASSGYNGCGMQDIAKPTRKRWFQTLKSTYADSIWAKSLKYYW